MKPSHSSANLPSHLTSGYFRMLTHHRNRSGLLGVLPAELSSTSSDNEESSEPTQPHETPYCCSARQDYSYCDSQNGSSRNCCSRSRRAFILPIPIPFKHPLSPPQTKSRISLTFRQYSHPQHNQKAHHSFQNSIAQSARGKSFIAIYVKNKKVLGKGKKGQRAKG